MARTLTPNNALTLLGAPGSKPLPDVWGARLSDEVHSAMWRKYPWRGTLADLPPFYLNRGVELYGPPLLAVPTDFQSLHRAQLVSSYGEIIPLIVQKELQGNGFQATPNRLEYDKSSESFRIYPVPAQNAPDWWVEGVYKKTPPKITSSNLNSYILPWDDQYFGVFRQGLEALYERDILKSKDWPFTMQAFGGMLRQMAIDEGLAEGTVAVAPEHALASDMRW